MFPPVAVPLRGLVLVGGAALAVFAGLAAPGCRPRFAPGEANGPACSNGIDDDANGLTDCQEATCAPYCGGGSDSGVPLTCGDGQRDPGESCDGADLGISSCITLGFTGGVLACGPACDYVTSGCTSATMCGDGACEGGETCTSCAMDCGLCCGNGTCGAGETCTTCVTDCGACTMCGNGICNIGESAATCPADCGGGPMCGNGTCEVGESMASCPTDCGGGTGVCGDGVCNVGETSMTCPLDCMGGTGPGCVETATPGCGGCACEACVCMFDPTCCTTAWGPTCTLFCPLCGGTCM